MSDLILQKRVAPIALFVYRRPNRTRRVLVSLLQNDLARESELFIFSDAPKTADAEDGVSEVRRLIRSVEGFKSVHIIERETNCGLARSIIGGVTQLCEAFGRVIVVEDDLVVAPHFLEFMNRGLEYYAADSRVMQISGHLFPFNIRCEEDAFFLPLTTSWGWATWARAWKQFDPDAKGYSVLRNDPQARRRFDLGGSYPYFKMLEQQLDGKLDSWGIRWHLSVFMQDGLVLHPKRNLVVHEGWDEDATHAKRSGGFSPESYDTEFRANKFPSVEARESAIEAMRDFFRRYNETAGHQSPLWRRAAQKVRDFGRFAVNRRER